MIGKKLKKLRKENKMTLEDVAEKCGVSRQTISKWESEETLLDILKCKKLAVLYNVSVDSLLLEDDELLDEERNGKYIFGIVKVGDRGQIVIPSKARKVFQIHFGDQLLILGDIHKGLAIMKVDEIKDIVLGKDE